MAGFKGSLVISFDNSGLPHEVELGDTGWVVDSSGRKIVACTGMPLEPGEYAETGFVYYIPFTEAHPQHDGEGFARVYVFVPNEMPSQITEVRDWVEKAVLTLKEEGDGVLPMVCMPALQVVEGDRLTMSVDSNGHQIPVLIEELGGGMGGLYDDLIKPGIGHIVVIKTGTNGAVELAAIIDLGWAWVRLSSDQFTPPDPDLSLR